MDQPTIPTVTSPEGPSVLLIVAPYVVGLVLVAGVAYLGKELFDSMFGGSKTPSPESRMRTVEEQRAADLDDTATAQAKDITYRHKNDTVITPGGGVAALGKQKKTFADYAQKK